jgi:hypothetical protein
MTSPRVVLEAKVEVVKANQLREGDRILWANLNCKVFSITPRGDVAFSIAEDAQLESHNYMHWYRILDSKEAEVCPICIRTLTNGKCDCQNKGDDEDGISST